ncbi:hypothetical protein IU481_13880 [Nocardia otitidiscaviarum]|nr:hypothetical protein [Nocardia otitidiscaviarum]
MTPERLRHIYQVAMRSVELADVEPTEMFRGNLQFFTATVDRTETMRQWSAADWQPYVSGRIVDHAIDVPHEQMTGDEALAVIGPRIAELLDSAEELRASQREADDHEAAAPDRAPHEASSAVIGSPFGPAVPVDATVVSGAGSDLDADVSSGPVEVSPLPPGAVDVLAAEPSGLVIRVITLDIAADCPPWRVRQSVAALFERHPGLRARLRRDADGLSFEYPDADPEDAVVWRFDWAGETSGDLVDSVIRAAAAELDPDKGRNVRFVLLDAKEVDPVSETVDEAAATLVVIANGLVVDDTSWRTIIEELTASWSGGHATPPAAVAHPAGLARELARRADHPDIVAELPWWLDALEAGPITDADPAGGRGRITVTITAEGAGAVDTVARRYQATIDEVLLTALAVTLPALDGMAELLGSVVRLPADGRLFGDPDAQRAIGAFTTSYPLPLRLNAVDFDEIRQGGPVAGSVIQHVRDMCRTVPSQGVGFGLLRHLGTAAPELAGAAGRIGFRYRDLRPARVHPETAAPDLHLDITVDTTQDGFIARFDYAGAVLSLDQVKGLVEGWVQALGGLAEHGRASNT